MELNNELQKVMNESQKYNPRKIHEIIELKERFDKSIKDVENIIQKENENKNENVSFERKETNEMNLIEMKDEKKLKQKQSIQEKVKLQLPAPPTSNRTRSPYHSRFNSPRATSSQDASSETSLTPRQVYENTQETKQGNTQRKFISKTPRLRTNNNFNENSNLLGNELLSNSLNQNISINYNNSLYSIFSNNTNNSNYSNGLNRQMNTQRPCSAQSLMSNPNRNSPNTFSPLSIEILQNETERCSSSNEIKKRRVPLKRWESSNSLTINQSPSSAFVEVKDVDMIPKKKKSNPSFDFITSHQNNQLHSSDNSIDNFNNDWIENEGNNQSFTFI